MEAPQPQQFAVGGFQGSLEFGDLGPMPGAFVSQGDGERADDTARRCCRGRFRRWGKCSGAGSPAAKVLDTVAQVGRAVEKVLRYVPRRGYGLEGDG
jgi:hypothetical protein